MNLKINSPLSYSSPEIISLLKSHESNYQLIANLINPVNPNKNIVSNVVRRALNGKNIHGEQSIKILIAIEEAVGYRLFHQLNAIRETQKL